MTREEAIKILQKLYEGCNKHKNTDLIKEAYNLAIEALKAQPNLQQSCNQLATDCISRQDAIDHWRLIIDATSTDSRYNMGFVDGLEFCISHLSTMPSAQPELHYDEWCTDCKEYNHERHCCPRWNRVIRETLKDAQPNTDHIYAELSKVYNVKGLPDAAIGIIGDLMLSLDGPSAQPEPKWIPCSERLPEKEGNYLITAQPTYNHAKDIRIAHWSRRWVGYVSSEILAWMPLPEPYKEGEQNED